MSESGVEDVTPCVIKFRKITAGRSRLCVVSSRFVLFTAGERDSAVVRRIMQLRLIALGILAISPLGTIYLYGHLSFLNMLVFADWASFLVVLYFISAVFVEFNAKKSLIKLVLNLPCSNKRSLNMR